LTLIKASPYYRLNIIYKIGRVSSKYTISCIVAYIATIRRTYYLLLVELVIGLSIAAILRGVSDGVLILKLARVSSLGVGFLGYT